MGYAIIPPEEDDLGELEPYRDQFKAMAESACSICNQPMGWDTKYFGHEQHPEGIQHAICVWTQIEEK